MTERVSLTLIRTYVDEALQILHKHRPTPASPYLGEYEQALVFLENCSLALYVRTVAPTADEILDVRSVQDLDVAAARRVNRA